MQKSPRRAVVKVDWRTTTEMATDYGSLAAPSVEIPSLSRLHITNLRVCKTFNMAYFVKKLTVVKGGSLVRPNRIIVQQR